MANLLGSQLRKPTGIFGRLVAKMMERRNKAYYAHIIRELAVSPGDRIFEIGYGPGLGVYQIASSGDCIVHGIDFSSLMHKEASRRNRKFISKGQVALHYGDLLTATPAQTPYDKVFCVNVVYFWSDLSKAFGCVHAMLAPGGSFLIFMAGSAYLNSLPFTADFCKYSIETVVDNLKSAGFDQVSFTENDGYYIRGVRKHP